MVTLALLNNINKLFLNNRRLPLSYLVIVHFLFLDTELCITICNKSKLFSQFWFLKTRNDRLFIKDEKMTSCLH